MQRSFRLYTAAGIIFTLILGSLSHFFYEWSGNFFPIGLVSPVNESVWEHLKLLFFPALLYMLVEWHIFSYRCPQLFCKNLLGLYAGLVSMPLLYYSYTFFTGINYLWADITIFVISVLITYLLTFALRKKQFTEQLCQLAKIVLWLLLGVFLLLSVYFMLWS